MISIIMFALLPIFFILSLGFTAGKLNIVNNAHAGELNTVLMNYALPAALFIATTSATREEIFEQWPVLVIVGGAMMSVYALWYLIAFGFLRRVSSDAALQALTVALPNAAAVGLPVVSALLGPGHAVPVAMVIATGTLLPSPLTLALLELSVARAPTANGGAALRFLRAISRPLAKPIMLAPVAGTVLSLLAWRLPPLAEALLQPLGAAAGGLALFITGLLLSGQRFQLSWSVVAATTAANILRPVLALGIAALLPVPETTAKMAIMFSAFPSGFYGVLFGANYGLNTKEVNSTVIASTVSSAITLSLTIAWLYG
ncbi:AEC family transporter [Sphingomonas sp.]|uniref:AEC family transporter n=1 Tax=Sphingomonas sp. TaxID=28214 RepID=UPI003D6D450C